MWVILCVFWFVSGLALAEAQTVVSVSPGDDVKTIVESGGPGVTYQFSPGVYRIGEIVPPDGTTFEGLGYVEINGSAVITNWQQVGETNVWVSNGYDGYSASTIGCQAGRVRCGARQAVFVDNVLYPEAPDLPSLVPGQFYLDYVARALYLVESPVGKLIEVTSKRNFISGTPDQITLEHLHVTKFGVPAGKAAIHQGNFDGTPNTTEGWVIRDVEVAWNRGAGIRIQQGGLVEACTVHHNSQYGLIGSGSGIRLAQSVIEANAWGGVNLGDTGAMKFTYSTNMVITDNTVRDNRGPGIWLDINNRDAVIQHNVVQDNDGPGIFYEISYRARIARNVVEHNGHGAAWTAWVSGAGILVSNSSGVEVVENAVIGNGDGIAGVAVERGSGIEGTYELADLLVHQNIIVMTAGHLGIVTNGTTPNPTDVYTTKGNVFTNNLIYSLIGPAIYRWNDLIGDVSIWPHADTERLILTP